MTAEPQPIDETVMRELRRNVVDRFAMTNAGQLAYCPFSRTRGADGTRPKIMYEKFVHARMCAAALVVLPGSLPIRIYECDQVYRHWHLTTQVTKRSPSGKRILLPPGWTWDTKEEIPDG